MDTDSPGENLTIRLLRVDTGLMAHNKSIEPKINSQREGCSQWWDSNM